MAEYIARISYGKDSLKMLEVIHSRGLPLDRITTTDVWATDTISANLPPMDEFKARMDQRIWELYHIEVEHLCARNKDGSKKTYEQMFYHVPARRSQIGQVERERERERERETVPSRIGSRIPGHSASVVSGCIEKGSYPPGIDTGIPIPRTALVSGRSQMPCPDTPHGTIKGFPDTVQAKWCQKLKLVKDQRIPGSNLSLVPKTQNRQGQDTFFDERSSAMRKDRNVVEYLGIAADEPKRFGQLNARKRAPLVEFGIDEDLCGLYCQYNDMLAPTYETSCRDGCWFCHNQGVGQLRLLRRNYPDLWALLMKWDLDSPVTFKADGHTVHDFDRRFQLEDEGVIPTDKAFRWDWLERPPGVQMIMEGF